MKSVLNPSKTGIFSRNEAITVGIVLSIVIILLLIGMVSIWIARADSQISRDASTVLSGVQQYVGDHSGNVPDVSTINISEFQQAYNLPSGYTYSFGTSSNSTDAMAISNRNCSGQAGASVHFFLHVGGSRCLEAQ